MRNVYSPSLRTERNVSGLIGTSRRYYITTSASGPRFNLAIFLAKYLHNVGNRPVRSRAQVIIWAVGPSGKWPAVILRLDKRKRVDHQWANIITTAKKKEEYSFERKVSIRSRSINFANSAEASFYNRDIFFQTF